MLNSSGCRHSGDDSASVGGNRRGFLCNAAAFVAAAAALLVPAIAGIVAFLNPLRQKGRSGQFIRLTMLDALSADGTPQRVAVVAERTDAWTKFPPEPVGAVFLRRMGDKVTALQVICPHAGCSINFKSMSEGGRFSCPCHAANFNLNGKRIDANSFSPRDMDTLEVEIRDNNEVWVKYQNFLAGTARKVPLG